MTRIEPTSIVELRTASILAAKPYFVLPAMGTMTETKSELPISAEIITEGG